MKQHEEISIRLQEEREKLAIQRQVDPGRCPVTLEDLTAGSPINHPFFLKEHDRNRTSMIICSMFQV